MNPGGIARHFATSEDLSAREGYFFGSRFQFISSVIGAAASSGNCVHASMCRHRSGRSTMIQNLT
jgi:hypothetical protein